MIRKLCIVLVALQISLVSCSQDERVMSNAYGIMLKALLNHSVPELAVSAVDVTEDYLFLDARALTEFEVSHIQDAIWVGYDAFDPSKLTDLDKDELIVVYCSVGYRSEKIAEQIEALGFVNVYNLYGGIFEWKNQGRTVVDQAGATTEQVHAFDKQWGRWLQTGEKVYANKK